MNRYTKFLQDLKDTGTGSIKMYGNSMTPIIKSGALLTFEVRHTYNVNDIVFCKVRGRFYAHRILRKGDRGYLICNNKGHVNGWTRNIYGAMV